MQYDNIGPSDLKSSKIILGTWQAGKSMWANIDDKETTRAIRGALDTGINCIDTAIEYGGGHSERIIAKALSDVTRGEYYLLTKVFADKLGYDQVIAECDKSLKNLATDYIDLYQIHWPAGAWGSNVVPINETMEALVTLKQNGKIRNIGVSNFTAKQLKEASDYGPIISNQPPYSLLWRQYEEDTNTYCRENNLAILAYSPLSQGILTGKFKKDHKFAAGDHRSRNRLLEPQIFPKVEEVLASLQEYADKYSTSIGNIALNWLVSQPRTFAIVGARKLSQVQDNAKACNFQLTPNELMEIDTLSRLVTDNMQQDGTLWQG